MNLFPAIIHFVFGDKSAKNLFPSICFSLCACVLRNLEHLIAQLKTWWITLHAFIPAKLFFATNQKQQMEWWAIRICCWLFLTAPPEDKSVLILQLGHQILMNLSRLVFNDKDMLPLMNWQLEIYYPFQCCFYICCGHYLNWTNYSFLIY